jgi:hypothetical protein
MKIRLNCLINSSFLLQGSGGQNISMRLHSQSEKSNAGFLLKYFGLYFKFTRLRKLNIQTFNLSS